jgi:hypothetical protein
MVVPSSLAFTVITGNEEHFRLFIRVFPPFPSRIAGFALSLGFGNEDEARRHTICKTLLFRTSVIAAQQVSSLSFLSVGVPSATSVNAQLKALLSSFPMSARCDRLPR